MQFLKYQNLPVTPWKNGGGVTREIGALHSGGDSSQFLWRVSIATVSASGPFSRFAGVDRTIAVLSGAGLRLTHPTGTAEITPTSSPYSFDGETPIDADILGGETIDLNAMSLRKVYTHHMQLRHCSPTDTITTLADVSILVFGGSAEIVADGQLHAANIGDALLDISAGTSITLSAPERTPVYLIGFQPIR